jgi:hypothetical protein
MAGQNIIAGIGVICLILMLFTKDTDTVGRVVLVVTGIFLIAYAYYSYHKANTYVPPKYVKREGHLVDIQDFIDKD